MVDGQNVSFYTDNDDFRFNSGSSLVRWSPTMKRVFVNSLGLAEFVKNLLHVYQPEAVLMKMDIEGTEFELFPYMYTSGALCGIDLCMLEYHDRFFRRAFRRNSHILRPPNGVLISNNSDSNFKCRATRVCEFDDETSKRNAWVSNLNKTTASIPRVNSTLPSNRHANNIIY